MDPSSSTALGLGSNSVSSAVWQLAEGAGRKEGTREAAKGLASLVFKSFRRTLYFEIISNVQKSCKISTKNLHILHIQTP